MLDAGNSWQRSHCYLLIVADHITKLSRFYGPLISNDNAFGFRLVEVWSQYESNFMEFGLLLPESKYWINEFF